MNVFFGLDFIAISLACLIIGILGLVIYLNDRKSVTNQTFFVFTILTVIYATINYLSSRGGTPTQVLWILRFTIFSAVWHAFYIFQLFFVLPKTQTKFPYYYKYIVFLAIITSLLTLTPIVFSDVSDVAPVGYVTNPQRGPGIALFGAVSFGLIGIGIALMIRKTVKALGRERQQLFYILTGTALTFILIFIFNFVLPVIFNVLAYIPFVPLYFFPFIVLTAYAIIKYRFLDIKVVATEVITFALWITLLIRAATAQNLNDILVGGAIFIASVALGILLIKSVLQEVKSREQVQRLALDLEIANRDLKRLDEAKSDFISIASHQLRTPLSIIKGYISMVREGTYGPVDSKLLDPLHKVYVSNERLINLVSDLLDLSRMERGRMQYQFEVIHLSDVVEGLVEDFAVVAKNKGLAFEWKKGDAKDVIKGDANKLRQVVLNLIDNAIKYTPAGKITVSTSQEGQTIVLSVTDTGPGLSADESHALFKKFSRGREEKSMHTEGTGLGLYVAKLIAQAHGGDLSVTSPGKGLGSTFSLAVPLYNDSQEKIETFVSNL